MAPAGDSAGWGVREPPPTWRLSLVGTDKQMLINKLPRLCTTMNGHSGQGVCAGRLMHLILSGSQVIMIFFFFKQRDLIFRDHIHVSIPPQPRPHPLPQPLACRLPFLFCPGGVSCYCSVATLFLTLRLHGLQHARLPSPSPSPRVCSNSCPVCLALPRPPRTVAVMLDLGSRTLRTWP